MTLSRKPSTRARTSTLLMALMRPTNSNDCLTPFVIAGRTPTAGLGGGAAVCWRSSQPHNNGKPRQTDDSRRMRKPWVIGAPQPSDTVHPEYAGRLHQGNAFSKANVLHYPRGQVRSNQDARRDVDRVASDTCVRSR